VIQNTGLRQRINDRALDAMVHSGNEFAQQRASLPGYQPIYGAPVLILLSAPGMLLSARPTQLSLQKHVA